MASPIVSTGTVPNDKTGDSALVAFTKINAAFESGVRFFLSDTSSDTITVPVGYDGIHLVDAATPTGKSFETVNITLPSPVATEIFYVHNDSSKVVSVNANFGSTYITGDIIPAVTRAIMLITSGATAEITSLSAVQANINALATSIQNLTGQFNALQSVANALPEINTLNTEVQALTGQLQGLANVQGDLNTMNQEIGTLNTEVTGLQTMVQSISALTTEYNNLSNAVASLQNSAQSSGTGAPSSAAKSALFQLTSYYDAGKAVYSLIPFQTTVYDDIGLTYDAKNHVWILPSGYTRVELTASLNTLAQYLDIGFSKNPPAGPNVPESAGDFPGNVHLAGNINTYFSGQNIKSAWVPFVAGDTVGLIGYYDDAGGAGFSAGNSQWFMISVK